MAWHLTTAVVVAVVLRDMVNIMEDQAVPVQVFHGLQESHIKQHGSVEGLTATLNTHQEVRDEHHYEIKSFNTVESQIIAVRSEKEVRLKHSQANSIENILPQPPFYQNNIKVKMPKNFSTDHQ